MAGLGAKEESETASRRARPAGHRTWAAMPTQGLHKRQLALLGPAGHRLGGDRQQLGHLCRRFRSRSSPRSILPRAQGRIRDRSGTRRWPALSVAALHCRPVLPAPPLARPAVPLMRPHRSGAPTRAGQMEATSASNVYSFRRPHPGRGADRRGRSRQPETRGRRRHRVGRREPEGNPGCHLTRVPLTSSPRS
jgi:hypothetical protein